MELEVLLYGGKCKVRRLVFKRQAGSYMCLVAIQIVGTAREQSGRHGKEDNVLHRVFKIIPYKIPSN